MKTESVPARKWDRLVELGAVISCMLLWGISLGYPLQRLQHLRWTFLGYAVPTYYFLTAAPMTLAAVLVLSRRKDWARWSLAWWLLPLTCLPGILHGSDIAWSTRQWLGWIVRGVIPGGIIFLVADQKATRGWLLHWIYPIVLAAALLGLWELYSDRNPLWDGFFVPIPETSQPDNPFYRPIYQHYWNVVSVRPWGTQGNRIPYASTIVAFLPLGFWALKYRKRLRWAYFPAVVALFAILILAQVRSVWLGTLVSLILMSVLYQRSLRETIGTIAGLSLCLLLLLAWPKTQGILWPRLHSFYLSQSSIQLRLEVFQTAKALKDHWGVGVGYGQFPTACRQYYLSHMRWVGTPDNQYLRWAIENGIPSLGLLLAFFVGLVRAGLNNIRHIKDVEQADYYKALLAGWAGIATTFFFFDGFYWGACNTTFWCLLGLFATCLNSGSEAA